MKGCESCGDLEAKCPRCIETRNRIVEENIPLAYWMARRLYDSGRSRKLPLEDVQQICLLALVRAVEIHDPERARLSTYASLAMLRMVDRAASRDTLIAAPKGESPPRIASIEDISPLGQLADDAVKRVDDHDLVERLLECLPSDLKRLAEAQIEGKTFNQIAREEGITRAGAAFRFYEELCRKARARFSDLVD